MIVLSITLLIMGFALMLVGRFKEKTELGFVGTCFVVGSIVSVFLGMVVNSFL